jgi:ribonucleoside-diphosphate reductase alpha chain
MLKITKIKLENKVDVFDITVPSTENFFANNTLVHNCSEIMLFNDIDHTYTCVLASMNGARYDEWKNTESVFWATVFLDCVAEEFIQRAEGKAGLEKAIRFTKKGRALGLGLCGLHTYFMQNFWTFSSIEAHIASQEISKHIWEEAQRATKDMAKKLGEPEWCKGYGVRNTHLIAIAPTKTTAGLMGGISEGIGPVPGMTFNQTGAAGNIDRIDPTFLEYIKKKGLYTKKHIQEITDSQGSVQKVSWLNDEEKAVFRTAFEINQKDILRLASARAQYIDQWQSLNLFFGAEEEESWISEVHKQAFLDPNILALYYCYSQAGVTASKDCESCQ